MNSKPAISVLIPVFNREKFIRPCLDSIVKQSYPNIEIIVYDDGSTDGTGEIVKSYPNTKYIRSEENKGVSHARNQLLQHCKTQYAAWQDSDDVSSIYRIEALFDALVENQTAVAFGYCIDMKKAANNAWAKEPIRIEGHSTQCFGGVLFDMEKVGHIRFNEEVDMGAEDLLWLVEAEKNDAERTIVHNHLYFVRRHPDRISSLKRLPENRNKKQKSDAAYHEALARINKTH